MTWEVESKIFCYSRADGGLMTVGSPYSFLLHQPALPSALEPITHLNDAQTRRYFLISIFIGTLIHNRLQRQLHEFTRNAKEPLYTNLSSIN